MAMVFINICLALILYSDFALGIGVNWGQTTSHNLRPEIAVQLLKDNGIDKVKLFGSDESMIKAFANTGISVIVGVADEDLKKYSDSYDKAKEWVEKSVAKHVKKGVNITYVTMGNLVSKINDEFRVNTFMLPAIKNIQKALDGAGLGTQTKATTALDEEIYDTAPKAPSKCDFNKSVKDAVVQLVRWLDENGSPVMLNTNPFRSYQELGFSYDSVFFNPKAKPIVVDNHTHYTNVFDLSVDKLAYSLQLAGTPNLKIIVGEIGWPTDGGVNANATLASKFYSGFLKKLYRGEGTPLVPGPMEVYLSSLLDEDAKSIARGNHERHWGIFRFDGQPKYPIDLSGHGNETMPVAAKGVQYRLPVYCVLNKMTQTNLSELPANLEYACKSADCTALSYGSSCNNLDHDGNISYAFNMYFQMYDHNDNACNFEGLATLSLYNPSTNTCFFPLQMLSAGKARAGLRASEMVVGILAMALFALL